MPWYRERVWQMGIGVVLILAGALLAYSAAANDPIQEGLMWLGLGLIFLGMLVPLLIQFLAPAAPTAPPGPAAAPPQQGERRDP